MKQIGTKLLFWGLVFTILVGGCSKKQPATHSAHSKSGGGAGGIDLNAAIDELKTAAAKMDLPQLEAKAKQYVEQIESKQTELKALMDKFSALPLKEKMGEEAKTFQSKIADMTGSINDLTQRLKIFSDAIVEKGGDPSKFAVPK